MQLQGGSGPSCDIYVLLNKPPEGVVEHRIVSLLDRVRDFEVQIIELEEEQLNYLKRFLPRFPDVPQDIEDTTLVLEDLATLPLLLGFSPQSEALLDGHPGVFLPRESLQHPIKAPHVLGIISEHLD